MHLKVLVEKRKIWQTLNISFNRCPASQCPILTNFIPTDKRENECGSFWYPLFHFTRYLKTNMSVNLYLVPQKESLIRIENPSDQFFEYKRNQSWERNVTSRFNLPIFFRWGKWLFSPRLLLYMGPKKPPIRTLIIFGCPVLPKKKNKQGFNKNKTYKIIPEIEWHQLRIK